MSPLYITIPGKANTNHRSRATSRGGKVRMYKDAGYREYLKRVQDCGRDAVTEALSWQTDLRYSVVVMVHEPDRRSRDLDNFAKGILDGLTGVAWNDDKQIDAIHIFRGEARALMPSVFVTVEVLE